jgi:ribosomal-protein-alanine N-acetyltransferase
VNTFVIRTGRETDLDALLQLERSAHAYPWAPRVFEDLFRSRYVTCSIIEDRYQNKLGFAFVQSVADEASLLNIVVSPEHQGKGIGRHLLNHLMDELAAGKVVRNVFLEVRVSNFSAIALYLSCGFVEVGERRDYYEAKNGSRENALMMALPLVV